MKAILAIIVLTLITLPAFAGTVAEHRALLDAIQQVETGGSDNPATAVGDGGKALGWYQIHRVYWIDAVKQDPGLAEFGYERCCTDKDLAERTVVAYWNKYAIPRRRGDSDEARARMHNGGLNGHKRDSTLKYWAKDQRHLNEDS